MTDSPSRTDRLTPLQRALLAIRELRAQIDEIEQTRAEPIAVIGIGCRLPGGATDPESFWRLLRDGADAIQEMSGDRWDVDAYFDPDPEAPGRMNTRWGGFLDGIDRFDPAFFGISPWEAANMDPQQRLMLEVAQEAFDDAGQVAAQLRGSRTGVFIGLAHSEYGWLNFDQPQLSNVYTATGSFGSIVANRVSYVYDLRGPSYTMDAVCSSSLLAVHQACDSLRNGDCTMALAGGVGLFLRPEGFVWFSKLGVMAADGRCKAFDARGDGIVLGEGVAAVVLKTLSQALADGDPIYAVLRGSAVAQDGRSNGLTAPSRLSQEVMLREAYRRAEVDPQRVQYVEAHGTGTILGDPIEAQALGGVLGAGRRHDRPLLIGSVKTNIGHLQMVGGLAGLIKVILAMKHRQLPASLHYTRANPHIPFDEYRLQVQDKLGPWPDAPPLLAGVTSLSFGGTNVHMVVEEPPPAAGPADGPVGDAEGSARLLPLSAQTPPALRDLAEAYRRFVSDSPALDLDDLCYTASLRRNHYDSRAAISFTSTAELLDRLEALRDQQARPGLSWADKTLEARRGPVFVCPGQGGQWVGMGRRLLDREPVFREAIEACAEAMRPHVSWSLLTELRADQAGSTLDRVDVVQPVTWAVQVALAALWRSWGIVPDAVVGHSMGEVAASHVAGTLSLDDAARVICLRSQLVRQVRGRGTMAVVELPLAQAKAAIAGYGDQLAIAASNSPTSTVLSGDTAAVEAVLKTLDEQEVFGRRINVDFASHSPHVDVLRADLVEALRAVRPRKAAVPIYSTVSGDPTDGREFTADYWARNLREPVLFAPAVQRLMETGHHLFIELSPHPVLLPSIEQSARHLARPAVALASLRRDEDEHSVLLGTLGTLYTIGHPVQWSHRYPSRRTVVRLPSYPWQRQRCWLDFAPDGGAGDATNGPGRSGPTAADRYFRAATAGAEHFWELAVDRGSWPEVDDPARPAGMLPEAAYLDLVLDAGTTLVPTADCSVTDVTIEEPLALAPGRVAQVALGAQREGRLDWQIFSRPAGAADADTRWTRHARGILRTAPGTGHPYLPPQDTPEEIQGRCTAGIPGAAYYRSRAAAGLGDAPALRTVQRLWRRDGEVLALLRADGMRRRPAHIDWTLLHGALGLLPLASPTTAATADYRPAALERLRVLRRAAGELWAHVRLREIGPDSLTGEIRLLDAELRVVAELTGLRLQAAGNTGTERAGADRAGAGEAAPARAGDAATTLHIGSARTGGSGPPVNRNALLALGPVQRRDLLAAYLGEQIAAVLGLPAARLEVNQSLTALGLNSLMVFELRNRLRVMYGTQIAAGDFLSGISVARIVDEVLAQLDAGGPAAGVQATPGAPDQAGPVVATPAAGPAATAVSREVGDWLVRSRTGTRPRIRLFCLPYAGGNASAFRTWADDLPAEVEVCAIQLPGRERRQQEPAFTRISSLVQALSQVLQPLLDLPFALFGHSMGGLVSFELARQLRREGRGGPVHLYVSATRAPQLPDPEPPLHRLPDTRLVDKLRAMNGTPEEILRDREVMALYLPVLRADFALVETYVHRTEPPLECPVSAFGGTHDPTISKDALAAWDGQTRGGFALEMLPGGHFFIHQSRDALLAMLTQRLTDDLTQLDRTGVPAEP